jgi:hypothetical protein
MQGENNKSEAISFLDCISVRDIPRSGKKRKKSEQSEELTKLKIAKLKESLSNSLQEMREQRFLRNVDRMSFGGFCF